MKTKFFALAEETLDILVNGRRRSLRQLIPYLLFIQLLAFVLSTAVAFTTTSEGKVLIGGSIVIGITTGFAFFQIWKPVKHKLLKMLISFVLLLVASILGWYLAYLLA